MIVEQPATIPLQCHVRNMIRRDLDAIKEIEAAAFGPPHWTEEDFLTFLRQRNAIGTVAEALPNRRVVGFMLYEIGAKSAAIRNLAVAPQTQRRYVGTQLVNRLKRGLRIDARNRITALVRERNATTLAFLKAQEFRAVAMLRNEFTDPDEDGIAMEYRLIDQDAKERWRHDDGHPGPDDGPKAA